MSDKYTVTMHREDQYAVVVLRVDGRYISTDYSKRIRIVRKFLKLTRWHKVQEVISKYERKAERLNEIERQNEHDYMGMVRSAS